MKGVVLTDEEWEVVLNALDKDGWDTTDAIYKKIKAILESQQ